MKTLLAISAALCCFLLGLTQVGSIPFPERKAQSVTEQPDPATPSRERPGRPIVPEEVAERPVASSEDDGSAMPLPGRLDARERTAAPGEDGELVETEPESESDEDEAAGAAHPPVPLRAPAPSMRKPRLADKALGPPPPPETWSPDRIVKAKAKCDSLITADGYDFEILEPIKDGACGAPAPIKLEAIKLNSKVEITPAATMTCPLADAVKRWMRDVVQPQAKELLEDEIVSVRNLSSYVCRNRYNSARERISYHAFAQAFDISAFVTAKGEQITLLEHWEGDDPKAKFLKNIHAGACKIFGTVLGPEANAAHKNHFHFDMAKRRFSAYCE